MKQIIHFRDDQWILFLVSVVFLTASTHVWAQETPVLLKLVKDINTVEEPLVYNDYSEWTDVGGDLYFVVKDRQLWVVKQSDPNAVMLKELDSIYNLSGVDGTVYFAADDGNHGSEPWKTDGTQEGTAMVDDINPGASGSDPSQFTYANGQVFFAARDGLRGRELWRSNGTSGSAQIVKDVMPAGKSSNPSNLVSINGLLYFVADDGRHGYEVWMTNGTPAKTQMLKDIRPGKLSSGPRDLTAVNGKLFFGALDKYLRRRLWVSDGTTGGTVMVADVGVRDARRGHGAVDVMTQPKQLTEVDGILFFSAKDPAHGVELWKSDGTAAGTGIVKDIIPGRRSLKHLRSLKSYEGNLYFSAIPGNTLWISDGTETGTKSLTNHRQIRLPWSPKLTGFNGAIYFLAAEATDPNIVHIFGIGTTSESLKPLVSESGGFHALDHVTASGNFLFYVRKGELWRTDGTAHRRIDRLYFNTPGSDPENITCVDGVMYFSAHDGHTFGLWKSDGTAMGTRLVSRFGDRIQNLTVSGDYLYYTAIPIDSGSVAPHYKLWRTGLTNDETVRVSNIYKYGSDYIQSIADVNGTLFISIEVPMIDGQEFPREAQIWKTTGTAETTQYIRSFNQASLFPEFLTNVNGMLFFSAITDPEVGAELWKSDGTASGTVLVKKINPNPAEPSMPSELISVNNVLYFSAYTGQYELWRSDGSETGTFRVSAINPAHLTSLNDTLYFEVGDQLWKSDGTSSGTVKIAGFVPPDGARVVQITLLGKIGKDLIVGTSYATFTNIPGALWKTDGTPEGTSIIVSPVDNLTRFTDITRKDSTIYFTGTVNNTPAYNLWRTDGTICGTSAVLTSGSPQNLVLVEGKIYLASTDQRWGRELFLLDESAIPPSCNSDAASVKDVTTNSTRNIQVVHYPNPFALSFVLHVAGTQGATYDVSITDFSGNVRESHRQLSYNVDHPIGNQLSSGIFFLKVETGREIAITKIVKR